jgi:hypothetical protein
MDVAGRLQLRLPAGMVKRCQPSRCTTTPKRASRFSVISM